MDWIEHNQDFFLDDLDNVQLKELYPVLSKYLCNTAEFVSSTAFDFENQVLVQCMDSFLVLSPSLHQLFYLHHPLCVNSILLLCPFVNEALWKSELCLSNLSKSCKWARDARYVNDFSRFLVYCFGHISFLCQTFVLILCWCESELFFLWWRTVAIYPEHLQKDFFDFKIWLPMFHFCLNGLWNFLLPWLTLFGFRT